MKNSKATGNATDGYKVTLEIDIRFEEADLDNTSREDAKAEIGRMIDNEKANLLSNL